MEEALNSSSIVEKHLPNGHGFANHSVHRQQTEGGFWRPLDGLQGKSCNGFLQREVYFKGCVILVYSSPRALGEFKKLKRGSKSSEKLMIARVNRSPQDSGRIGESLAKDLKIDEREFVVHKLLCRPHLWRQPPMPGAGRGESEAQELR